jgi:class 3 adenylate cyclase/tetratricopeptide (TPR) repeat protein
MLCSSCGFSNQEVARFCGGCGTLLNRPLTTHADAERRVITVIFCDIVGITALSEALDPEDLRELLSLYHQTCSRVVDNFDGYLADVMGDGVVIYFGFPQAHEDDEVRAVRCALAIQKSIRQIVGDIRYAFKIRIGVHRGRVVVGALGCVGGHQALAIGETPNISSRLQSEAEPGDVVVSDSLWHLISYAFDAEHLGSRRLKGIQRPIEVYRILKGRSITGRKMLATPLVGRQMEIDAILSQWQLVLAGQAKAIWIRGEPGIGKSCLIRHLLTQINDDEPIVLESYCNSFSVDTPFFPLSEMLRSRLKFDHCSPGQNLATLSERLVSLGMIQPEALPLLALFLSLEINSREWSILGQLSLARQRQRTMELLEQGLRALARQAPLVLIVEDLHWADPSTIEFLQQLFRGASDGSLMLVFTSRPEFHPSWMKQDSIKDFFLESLLPEDSEKLIRSVALDKALPRNLMRQICLRSDGNPLFLEEITLSLLASNSIVERAAAWELVQPFSNDLVPASLEAALMARLDQLGSTKSLLQLGATLGREFRIDLFAAVASMDESELGDILNQMVAEGFLRLSDHDHGVYVFKHALIQDVAYESLLRSTRQCNHARIANVMADSFPELAHQRPELMAHHLSGASRFSEAAKLWLLAGQMAAARSAISEAVEHLNRGLADLQQLPPERLRCGLEFSVLNSLAPVQMAAYGWASPLVETTSRRAIELALSFETEEQLFVPLWGLWSNRFVAGQLQPALDSALQLLSIAKATGLHVHAVAGHNAASYTYFYRAEYAQAIQQAEHGLSYFNRKLELELCMALQSAPTVHILSAHANALWMQGRKREAQHGMGRMLRLARGLRHPPTLAAGLCFLCFFCYYDHNWELLLTTSKEALDLSDQEGYVLWHACAEMYKATALIALGSNEISAEVLLHRAQLFRETGALVTDPSTSTIFMTALQRLGCLEEALKESKDAVATADRGHVKVMVPEVLRHQGNVLAALERFEEADQSYRQAARCARLQSAASLEQRAVHSLQRLKHRQGG